MLQKAGKQSVVIEAHTVGYGTTGGTSVHVNTFADTTYSESESAFGGEDAQLLRKLCKMVKTISSATPRNSILIVTWLIKPASCMPKTMSKLNCWKIYTRVQKR